MNIRDNTSGRGWAYTGATLGGLVSIAANVAHSFIAPSAATAGWHPEPGAVVGAIVWPVFLFIAIEILVKPAWPAGWHWGLIRWGGLLPVALVAAFVSYRHLSGLLAHYGEEPLVYYLGPLAVDGLMVMATGALLATGRHRTTPVSVSVPAARPSTPAPAPTPQPSTVDNPQPSTDPAPEPVTEPASVVPTPDVVAARITTKPPTSTRPDPVPAHAAVDRATRTRTGPPKTPAPVSAAASTDPSVTAQAPAQLALPIVDPALLDRATEVARQYRTDNGTRITPGQLAVRLKVTTDQAAKLLQALDDTPTPSTPTVNGRPMKATP